MQQSADVDALLARAADLASASEAPTNLDRAARYEILGVVERLRAWRATGDGRLLSECDVRLTRLVRHVSRDQAVVVEQLAGYVRSVGSRGDDRAAVGSLVDPGSDSPASVENVGEHGLETFELLVATLVGLSRGLRRWPSGGESRSLVWPIASEDAVQRLVWLALAPVFRQMRFEETVGPTGPPRWRPDFVLPDLGLAIEAKFLRTAMQWTSIFGQIAEDDGYCRSSGSPYTGLVVVIWDHGPSTERHEEWQASVLSLASVRAVVVVPRPGSL